MIVYSIIKNVIVKMALITVKILHCRMYFSKKCLVSMEILPPVPRKKYKVFMELLPAVPRKDNNFIEIHRPYTFFRIYKYI